MKHPSLELLHHHHYHQCLPKPHYLVCTTATFAYKIVLQKWRKARKKCLGRFCFDLLRLFLGVVDVQRVDGNLMVMAVIVMGSDCCRKWSDVALVLWTMISLDFSNGNDAKCMAMVVILNMWW